MELAHLIIIHLKINPFSGIKTNVHLEMSSPELNLSNMKWHRKKIQNPDLLGGMKCLYIPWENLI